MSRQDYIEQGAGETVLLLHSSMSSKSQWKGLISQLSESHRVIALDLMGYGAAEFPAKPQEYSLKSEADRINQLLVELGVGANEMIQVIGHSFGGAVALRWCYANQKRVKALHIFEPVAFHLLNGQGSGFEQISGVVAQLDKYMEAGDQGAACQAFIDYWSGAGAFASFPTHIQSAMVGQVEKVFLDFRALLNEKCSITEYGEMTFPITLLKGSGSPIASRSVAELLETNMRNLTCREFDCGHMGPITHASQINDVLLKAVVADC